MVLTVGSLFSGIGGIDLGLERAGMKVRWQVEIDAWCRAVLAKHWPDVERFEDVRSVGADNLPRVDLIAGGFPCQDISGAGQGEGISGPRSGLWGSFARIIGELRPRYVLVENVALLKSRGLEVVLADLAALGYDAEWDCIPAAAVGAPHRRDRLWLVAHANVGRRVIDGQPDGGQERSELEAPQRDDADGLRSSVAHANVTRLEGRNGPVVPERPGQQPARTGGTSVADASRDVAHDEAQWAFGERARSLSELDRARAANRAGWWFAEPNVGRVAHGIPNRVDRLRGLGNAVVPQVVEWIGRRIVEAEAMRSEQ